MIETFADKATADLYGKGLARKFPPDIAGRALRKLDAIDAAQWIEDLKEPPSNRLHALKGSRKGQYSISVNKQWRICFEFRNGNAYEVELCDYH